MIRFFRTVWRDFWAHVATAYERERDASPVQQEFAVMPVPPELVASAAAFAAKIDRDFRAEALRELHEAEQRWGIAPRVH